MHFPSLLAIPLLLVGLAAGSPIKLESRAAEVGQGHCYKGKEFPGVKQWLDFETLFKINTPVMLHFDSQREIASMKKVIKEVARKSGLDARILLTVIMQESTGNMRTRAGDGVTPGIMQALGSPSCEHRPFDGCNENSIRAMIRAGVFGTSKTQGLKSCYDTHGKSYGPALRCYNSGSIKDPSNLAATNYGTPSYVSDVANRLRGVAPPESCAFGAPTGSPGW
ncbi:hypothetical protein FQN53_009710 [Emmonsiellopsis sp. PD_33]|nr:hypothetical protein FQN53_009710 [Emmonsiellopsis sp. PD_33]